MVLFLALSKFYYTVFSPLSQNSDSASGYLRALDAYRSGDLMLNGWSLPVDTFWSSDFLLMVALLGVFGPSYRLLVMLPAILWALVVVLSGYLATRNRQASQRWIAIACVSVYLGLPILWGPGQLRIVTESFVHVGSLVLILLGYALLLTCLRASNRFVWVFFAGFVGYSVIGDPMVYVLGWLPVLVASIYFCFLGQNVRGHACALLSTTAGIALGVFLNRLFASLGLNYEPYPLTELVAYENWDCNWAVLIRSVFLYSGTVFFSLKATDALYLLICGCRLPLVFSLFALIGDRVRRAVSAIQSRLETWRSSDGTQPPDDYLNFLLLSGVAVNLAAMLTSHTVKDTGSFRYLLPGAVFAWILFSRNVPNLPMARWLLGASTITTLALYTIKTIPHLGEEPPTVSKELRDVGGEMLKRGLHHGFAEYWQAHILTVAADERLQVRACSGANDLHAYVWQSRYDWYDVSRWQSERFFVLTREDDTPGYLRTLAARKTFGEPVEIIDFLPFKVLIYEGNNAAIARLSKESDEAKEQKLKRIRQLRP